MDLMQFNGFSFRFNLQDEFIKVESFPQDSIAVAPSCSVISNTPTNHSSSSRRKRSFGHSFVKDPQMIAEELARKRAKNNAAAKRYRQRRIMKIETLEKNELKTRLIMLEEKNLGRDNRIKMLESQLNEAHQEFLNSS